MCLKKDEPICFKTLIYLPKWHFSLSQLWGERVENSPTWAAVFQVISTIHEKTIA